MSRFLAWLTGRYDQAPDDRAAATNDGIRVLQSPREANVDICFVHGLTGNRIGTWMAAGQSVPWPESLLPQRFPNACILTFGYDANFINAFSAASSNRLLDHATSLLHDLEAFRAENGATSRPLIFVAHSLGGLVCKKAILRSRHNTEPHLRDIFTSVRGIIFMGTPHQGSWASYWASIAISKIGIFKSTNPSLLEVLRKDNELLASIHHEFISMIREQLDGGRDIHILCCYEEMQTSGAGIIVEKSSAVIEPYAQVSIQANHADMTKFISVYDNGFIRIASTLGRWIREINDHRLSGPRLSDAAKAALQVLYANDPENCAREIAERNERVLEKVYAWLVRTEAYTSFVGGITESHNSSPRSRLLWISGPAGVGKTMLLIGLVDNLAKYLDRTPPPSISYFFCQELHRNMNKPATILRSLIWMLLKQQPRLIFHLIAKLEISGPHLFNEKPAFYSLKDIFISVLRDPSFRESFFIVDGIDQLPKPAALQLYHLIEESLGLSPQVRWLVASRPVLDIQARINGLRGSKVLARLIIIHDEQVEESVNNYIDEKLSQLRNRPGYTPQVVAEITAIIQNLPTKTMAQSSFIFKQLSLIDGCNATKVTRLISSDETQLEATTDWNIMEQALKNIADLFRTNLDSNAHFRDISTISSVGPIWEAVEQLQERTKLRHLARIGEFLDRLGSHVSMLCGHMGASKDSQALIWGPVHLLLMLSGASPDFLDILIESLIKLGQALPPFKVIENTVPGDSVAELLLLFYKDILEFYLISLKFFLSPVSKIFFELASAHYNHKVVLLLCRIQLHVSLIRDTVTCDQIREKNAARWPSIDASELDLMASCRAEYHALWSRIVPYAYDKILDRAQDRTFEGTTKWLSEDQSFIRWLNTGDRHVPLLWLSGNPGSGKTFAAAAAVAKASSKHNCLSIFASYAQRDTATAKSIFQSLMFQAARSDTAMQSILLGVDERELTSGTKSIIAMFEKLMLCSGPSYIIIDGLDEIDELERGTVLQHVIAFAKKCTKLKVLISGRPSEDIENELKEEAKIIVHERNARSIQNYVDQRTPKLLEIFAGDTKAKSEIHGLLMRLSAESKGMFLYARIIMDKLGGLSSLYEVREYLKVLPKDMDEVYHRVLKRITEKRDERESQKARAIIGWIGCAPIPMTTLEIEQALLVKQDDTIPEVTGRVPFVRLCGPIVEISDNCLQFVHFTVKEYFIGSADSYFVNITDANQTLANTCLRYLNSALFNIENSDEQIEKDILNGKFRLQPYAVMFWIKMVNNLVTFEETLGEYAGTARLLDSLSVTRRNVAFNPPVDADADLPSGQNRQSQWSQAYKLLQETVQFRQDNDWADWSFANGLLWVDRDPLTLSRMACRLHHHTEYLIMKQAGQDDTDHKGKLQVMMRHYGPGLFKCIFPSCHMSRQGFTTAENRREHIKNHSRPWKCTIPDCEFAIIGFNSRNALMRHMSKCRTVIHQPPALSHSFEEEELQMLLFEAIRQKNIVQLQLLLSSPTTKKLRSHLHKTARKFWDGVGECAARSGSIAVLELVLGHLEQEPPAAAVVESESVDLFKWLLKRVSYSTKKSNGILLCSRWYEDMVTSVLQTENNDLYCLWEDYLFTTEFEGRRTSFNTVGYKFQDLLLEYQKTAVVFSKKAISVVKANPSWELRLTKTWQRFARQGNLSPCVLGYTLKFVAETSCSMILGSALVDLGADVNFPARGSVYRSRDGEKRPKGKTVLHTAAHQSSLAAAKFMEFLIQKKANPIHDHAGKLPGEEYGALEIHRHLGVTWDELIARNSEDSDIERWAEQANYGDANKRKRGREYTARRRKAEIKEWEEARRLHKELNRVNESASDTI